MNPSEELKSLYNMVSPTGERLIQFDPHGPMTSMTKLAERVEKTEIALALVLDHVDYTSGACGPTEMVAATLPKEILAIAKEASNAA